MGMHSAFFCPWWPWHSNLSNRGTKHIFPVKLAQIHLAIPRDIWFTNKRKQKKQKTSNYQTYTACTPPKSPISCCTSFAAYNARATVHCQWGWCRSFPDFVPGDPDLWPWHSNSCGRGTKHTSSLWILHKSEICDAQTKWKSHRQR